MTTLGTHNLLDGKAPASAPAAPTQPGPAGQRGGKSGGR